MVTYCETYSETGDRSHDMMLPYLELPSPALSGSGFKGIISASLEAPLFSCAKVES